MRTVRSPTLVCAGLWASAALACADADAKAFNYPVLVRAVDDGNNPLANVTLSAGRQSFGVTDATGQRVLRLPGEEGERVDMAAVCPPGYEGPRERPTLLLKRTQDLSGTGTQPIEVTVTCDAKEHVELVALRTGQAGVPVLLRGQPVAMTSATGTAHVLVREPVGNSFQLTLDTAGKADLRPESPTRMFTVTQHDAFAVWDQPFELEKKQPLAKKHGRSRRKMAPAAPIVAEPPPPPKHIPERLR